MSYTCHSAQRRFKTKAPFCFSQAHEEPPSALDMNVQNTDVETKMSKSIKELSLHFDPINESNTFTSGDIVEGRVVLEVTKEIKVDSFFVKLTGDAHVSWTEGSGDDESTYSDHERYFKLKQYFIQESSKKGEVAH